MYEIVKNIHNLKDEDITKTVVRVKALIINSKNEVLLGHSHCEYQFPGGHVEDTEDLNLALRRELREETGLIYDTLNLEPFAVNIGYHKDHPKVGENTKTIIYYYEVIDDRIPDLSNVHYTDEELDGNYKLRYIPLDILKEVLDHNVLACGDPQGIVSEMYDVLYYYLNGKITINL